MYVRIFQSYSKLKNYEHYITYLENISLSKTFIIINTAIQFL